MGTAHYSPSVQMELLIVRCNIVLYTTLYQVYIALLISSQNCNVTTFMYYDLQSTIVLCKVKYSTLYTAQSTSVHCNVHCMRKDQLMDNSFCSTAQGTWQTQILS